MATMTAVDSGGRLAKALEEVRATAITFLGESSSEMTAFDTSLSKFIQELPSTTKDFGDAGSLHIEWKSGSEESCLRVHASRNKVCEIHWASHAMMFRITPHLLHIVALVAKHHVYNELHMSHFKNQNDNYDVRPPCLEDVLQAFSKAGYWKHNLKQIVVAHCYMNAVGDDFELEGAYPEALEDLHSCWPANRGGVESSTVYKVALKAKKLKTFHTGGSGGTDMILTETAFDTACGILANTNCLGDAISVPNELHNGNVANEKFDKVLKALTMGHAQPPVQPRVRSWDASHALASARYYLLGFYLCVNKYRAFFGGRCTRAMVPFVLEYCQDKEHTEFNVLDLKHEAILYYVLRENAADWIGRHSDAQAARKRKQVTI